MIHIITPSIHGVGAGRGITTTGDGAGLYITAIGMDIATTITIALYTIPIQEDRVIVMDTMVTTTIIILIIIAMAVHQEGIHLITAIRAILMVAALLMGQTEEVHWQVHVHLIHQITKDHLQV
jgi:hypothetical protein